MIKNKEMKIYKYLTRISIASCMLFGVSIFQGCMEDSLNDRKGYTYDRVCRLDRRTI